MRRKRLLLISFCAVMLGLLGWCGISEYTLRTMSASAVLARLARVSDRAASDATLRQALLTHVPIGTRDSDIITFLEHNGVERDRFASGQFVRYQVQDEGRTILALLTSPPWIIRFFCSPGNVGVRFLLDDEHKLHDIVIEDYTRCL
jgi:hypothetical protein